MTHKSDKILTIFVALIQLWNYNQSRYYGHSYFLVNAFQNNKLLTINNKHNISPLKHKNHGVSTKAVVTKTVQEENQIITSSPSEEEDEGEVSFPPPLTPIQNIERAVTFWSTAVPIVLSYYGKYAEIAIREKVIGNGFGDDDIQRIWDEQHEIGADKLTNVITSLKGFYVKTAQIIASRQDLFPKQYTEALSIFTDDVDPMPSHLVKAIIKKELLNPNESFGDVFVEFDDKPLGSASVAQVHRAVLSAKYGNKEVAVKVQRPSIESKLLGDIANLKSLAKSLKSSLPLDYYTVFAELEKQLTDEFDFVAEASAMDRIYNSLSRSYSDDGNSYPVNVPVVIPRPVSGLISRRVLVMDYLKGVPLSRARDEMMKKGIDPDGPEAKLFGKKLLKGLTYIFGRSILETGFFHADPHPGNIFVLDDGRIGLIDYGQVKQISGRNRETLAKVMIALNKLDINNTDDLRSIGKLALELGVKLNDDAPDDAAPAVAYWLFDGSVETLPGGYDKGELSPNSPVKQLRSFPQDLVLVGRSSILIKGLSNRLNIPWSLAKEWAPIAEAVLKSPASSKAMQQNKKNRVRFRQVWYTFKSWGKGRINSLGTKLPTPIRRRVASIAVYLDVRNNKNR